MKRHATSPATTTGETYKLENSQAADWTHAFDEIQLVPADVVRRFGPGHAGDGFKVSRQWVFSKRDLIFTLYDWKSTYLYDVEFWTPEDLWASEFQFDLHIGSKAPATKQDAAEFAAYLRRVTAASLPPSES